MTVSKVMKVANGQLEIAIAWSISTKNYFKNVH